jgi:hypothetical protein
LFFFYLGGLNDHPTPLDALYRLRMIILGKGPGMVQSNLNTEDKSEEDFIVAKVLWETEAVEHNSHATKFDKIDLESDSTSSTTLASKLRDQS